MIFTPKNSILTYCSSNREEVAQFQLLVGHYRFALRFQGIGSLVNLVEPLRLFKNLHKVLKFEYSHFGSLKQDVLKDLQFDLAVKYFFGHKYMCDGYQKFINFAGEAKDSAQNLATTVRYKTITFCNISTSNVI